MFDSRQGLNSLSRPKASTPAMLPCQPLIQCLPGSLSPGIKRPRYKPYLFPPSRVEVKITWSYISTPTCVIMPGTVKTFRSSTNESNLVSPHLGKVKRYALSDTSDHIHTGRCVHETIPANSFSRKPGRPKHRSGSGGVRNTSLSGIELWADSFILSHMT